MKVALTRVTTNHHFAYFSFLPKKAFRLRWKEFIFNLLLRIPEMSRVGSLPRIVHPLSRLDNPDQISVRGMSRASGRSSHFSVPVRDDASIQLKDFLPQNDQMKIPEGIKTVPSANGPAMPIFGSRASVLSESRCSTAMSNSSLLSRPDTQSRIEVDEIESILQSRLRTGGGVTSFLQAFKNNDMDGKGSLGKEALKHCLIAFTGRKMTAKQLFMLLKRMHLDKKGLIKFEDFCNHFNTGNTTDETPGWLDPVARENSQRSSREHVKISTPLSSSRDLRPREVERNVSINIEKWLKNKFREGFKALKVEFKREDPGNTGKVSRDTFRRIIAQFGLYLRDEPSLRMFLARCDISPRGEVSYVQLLNRFQDRSELGIAHNVLMNKKHRFNREERSISPRSTATAVEAKLLTILQSDFLSLLGMFNKLDKYNKDVVSQQEFRAALESRFNLDLKDAEFDAFIEQVPLDEEGQVKYAEFMSQFDTKKDARSLWDGKSCITEKIPDNPKDDKPRTEADLHALLKSLVRNKMTKLELEFHDLDEYNSGRLDQEMLYQLLIRLKVEPGVARGEIRRIWDSFITNKNNSLSFHQFLRHYGYSLKSAAYPNAKLAPPQRGDNDYMMKSRKLNCAADMLEDNLRAKIEYLWEDLRRDFIEMDPYKTGMVSREEFSDILHDLCAPLTDREIETIANKFDLRDDGRVSYVELIRPFAMKFVPNRGNMMNRVLAQPNVEIPLVTGPILPEQGLGTVTTKLKSQLTGDWRTLRRAFRKMDTSSVGTLTLPEFKSVLKLCNVMLDEDEVYRVLSQYDKDLSGKLDYKKFLRDSVSRMSSTSTTRSLQL